MLQKLSGISPQRIFERTTEKRYKSFICQRLVLPLFSDKVENPIQENEMEFVHMKKIQKDGVSLSRRYITWVGTDCRDGYSPLCVNALKTEKLL